MTPKRVRPNDSQEPWLSDAQRLQLQQLRLLAAAEQRQRKRELPETREKVAVDREMPPKWTLTRGLDLHSWQIEARDAWFAAGRRGTIKVVTGAGKTVVALAIAEQLQRDDPDLRVAVVVPTIVLMQQWYETFLEHSNLPAGRLGRLGGGHADDFAESRVLLAVLASARKELPAAVRRAAIAEHLLLIADESHRTGAPEMSAVLSTERAYSLGLSATPERDDEESGNDVLSDELGEIVYEMSFADAIRDEILPPFEIHHYGLPLSPDEGREYDALTRSVNDARRELRAISPSARKAGGGEGLLAWARRVSARRSDQIGALAAKFVNDTTRRKQLLYRAEARTSAALALVRLALTERTDARVILFHESIHEVAALFHRMTRDEIPAVMEHSELSPELREATLDLFRSGVAQVVVSARSLIEGFNVPEADLGVVVASSSSARQRIQSIGRVLRKYRDSSGVQKTSRVCVLYVRNTVDEAIYEKEDWERLIGLERNRYFHWDPPADPVEQAGPPRDAIPGEADIDITRLQEGAVYPGRYDGVEYSTDHSGNVTDADGRIAANPQDVPLRVARLRGGRAGRFKVTPLHRAVLVRRASEDDAWETVFAGVLDDAFDFSTPARDAEVDVDSLAPGDAYAGPVEPSDQLWFRQRRGGVIAKRVRGGEVFARGREADRVVAIIRELTSRNGQITKVFVNDRRHVFWHDAGSARFIAALVEDLQFPALETS